VRIKDGYKQKPPTTITNKTLQRNTSFHDTCQDFFWIWWFWWRGFI